VNVQPYFPEPIAVSDNIGADRYDVRHRFIRAVVAGYLGSLVIPAALPIVLSEPVPLSISGATVVAALLILSLIRKLAPHGRADLLAIALCALPVLGGRGALTHALTALGWPVWMLGLAIGFAGLYTFLCGRDFSFLGQYVLALGATLPVAIPLAWWLGIPPARVAWTSLAAAAFLFFWVYDLAALLTRRRKGEEVQAVADLYRDCLNILSYSFRVIDHWRKFRI